MNRHKKNRKLRIRLQFYTQEIPLKVNRTKKKAHQNIGIAFDVIKEFDWKFIWNKKNDPLKLGPRNTFIIVDLYYVLKKIYPR